jgi:GNAT superfamily N-acetyltransferase
VAASYEITGYRPELRTQIVELQRHVWTAEMESNAAYFAWKYERNPYLDDVIVHVALHEGRVVGMRGMSGTNWRMGTGEVLPALCAGDSVIHADHRDQGLQTRIMRAAEKDIAKLGYRFAFNFSGTPVTRLASLAAGWRRVRRLEALVRSRRRGMVDRILRRQPVPFRRLDERIAHHQGRLDGPVSVEVSSRPADMAELVRSLHAAERIHHVRDETFFAWRFQNPCSTHRFFFLGDSRLDGYLVLQKTLVPDPTIRGINILDWEGRSTAARAALLDAVVRWCPDAMLRVWACSVSAEDRTLLLARGFKPEPQPVRADSRIREFIVLPTSGVRSATAWLHGGVNLLDADNWELRMAYSDFY